MKTPSPDRPGIARLLNPTSVEKSSDRLSHSRRRFIGTAAYTAGAIGLSPLLGSSGTKAEAVTTFGRRRAIQAFEIRRNAAIAEFGAPAAVHRNNGDEQQYTNRIGNYSKGLQHDNLGD